MRKDPIDFDSPLGISKREWTKVLGVNLALLLIVYAVALVCTLCGSDLFLLKFFNERLDAIEEFLLGKELFWVFQVPIATVEETIICAYVAKRKPSIFLALSYMATYYAICVVIYFTTRVVPGFTTLALGLTFSIGYAAYWCAKRKDKRYILVCFLRLLIASVISFVLNEAIGAFRTLCFGVWKIDYSNSFGIALNVEYDLALALTFGFLTLLIPWEKGESAKCQSPNVGGSSPTTTNSLRKNSKIAKTNLSPKLRRRLFFLKAKVIAIQTVAFIVIAALPVISGRGIEFALVYTSFCATRLILGFNRSLHFKSELSCVTIGALTFWGLTFLSPSAEASIILSLVYGCATALGFRLYWELHDLMMYKKAAKTDRYAMLYVVFKGNVDPKHINGVMRAKGYNNETYDIKMVQMYMAKEKVDYIAEWTAYAKITIEKRLTEIAYDLYQQR